jgi:hypothetical protein
MYYILIVLSREINKYTTVYNYTILYLHIHNIFNLRNNYFYIDLYKYNMKLQETINNN